MLRLLTFILLVLFLSHAQTTLIIVGKVIDARTKEPLSFATIGLKTGVEETISKSDGTFELRASPLAAKDTLRVVYLGYRPWSGAVATLTSMQVVELEETATLLNEVVVTSKKFNSREVDRSIRSIRGNIYAMSHEVTNSDYNTFLAWLEDNNKSGLRKQFDYQLSGYSETEADFFRRYAAAQTAVVGKKDPAASDNGDYPAVNVTWAGAVAYCDWLTEQYNTAEKKKKFKKVKFRLPSRDEWQVAALGDEHFQSWKYEENFIQTTIAPDTVSMLPKKGKKVTISVNEDVLYPWWVSWHYRNQPQNHMNCWMGNFLVVESAKLCPARNPSYDGWSMMGRAESYFPNNIGLYDVVGNVAEMISVEGLACGGSWNDPPEKSTIKSVKTYKGGDKSVGFRVFMEVVE